QWVLDGNPMNGFKPEHGNADAAFRKNLGARQGLRMALEQGTKTGQGHPEQWLSIMAISGLPSSQKILFDKREYQIGDMVRQAMWDIYDGKEASWTLAALLNYVGPDAKWTASDGQEWTIDKIVGMEAKQDLALSACGGTHRLTALFKALREHR